MLSILLFILIACNSDKQSGYKLLNDTQLQSVVISTTSTKASLIKESNNWRLKDSHLLLINQQVESMLLEIAEAFVQKQQNELRELADYGISSNSDYIELNYLDTKSNIRLSIGDYSDYFQKYFAVVENTQKVLLLDPQLVEKIRSKGLPAFLQPTRRLLTVESKNVQEIVIKSINQERIFKHAIGTGWLVNNMLGDQVFINQLLHDLVLAEGQLLGTDLAAEYKNHYINNKNLPDLVVTLKSEQGQVLAMFQLWQAAELKACLVYNPQTMDFVQMPFNWLRKIFPALEIFLVPE